jgi:hypothetical protein
VGVVGERRSCWWFRMTVRDWMSTWRCFERERMVSMRGLGGPAWAREEGSEIC